MYRRSLFAQFGLFEEHLDAVEDLEFNYRLERAGLKAYMSPKFTVFYYPRATLKQVFRQMYRYGLGRINFGRMHPERLRAEVFAPVIASVTALSGMAAFLASTRLRPTLGVAAMLLAVLIISLTAPHICYRKSKYVWLAPLCLATIYLGLSCGVLCALLRRGSARASHFAISNND